MFVAAIVLAAVALTSCGNKCANAEIKTQADSLNYAFGMINADGIRKQVLGADSADSKKVDAFLDGFFEGYNQHGKELVKVTGKITGSTIGKDLAKGFIFNDSSVTAKKDLIMTAMERGARGQVGDQEMQQLYMYFQQKMGMSMYTGQPCNPSPQAVDSLNTFFGVMNGIQARRYYLGKDTTDKDIDNFLKGVNKGLKMKSDSISEIRLTGMNVGMSLTMQIARVAADTTPDGRHYFLGDSTLTVNAEAFGRGVLDGLKRPDKQLMSAEDAKLFIGNLEQKVKERQSAPVKEAGEKFLAENGKREGVTTTESGLQYEVIEEGKGKQPNDSSTVKVHYTGTLIDGTVFDSSVERGEPIEFPLNGVIRGWQEGLKLMKEGAKYKLYIPYQLGYGENGAGEQIPPYSALIFDVELISVK